jgi:hypothetical protein
MIMEREKEERKNKSEAEKNKQKAARDELNRFYGYAIVDGKDWKMQEPSRRSMGTKSSPQRCSRVEGSTQRPDV